MSSERWSCTVKLEYVVGKNNEKASNNSWGSKIIKRRCHGRSEWTNEHSNGQINDLKRRLAKDFHKRSDWGKSLKLV